MPCYSPDYYALRAEEEHLRARHDLAIARDEAIEKAMKLGAKLNDLTVMLCSACGVIEREGKGFPTPELWEWWQQHKLNEGHDHAI